MTQPNPTEAVRQSLIWPLARLNNGHCQPSEAMDDIMAKLTPLLSLLDEMHAVTNGCGHAVSLSADYRKALAALVTP